MSKHLVKILHSDRPTQNTAGAKVKYFVEIGPNELAIADWCHRGHAATDGVVPRRARLQSTYAPATLLYSNIWNRK